MALDPLGDIGNRARGNILLIKAGISGDYGEYIDSVLHDLESNPLDTTNLSTLAFAQQNAGLLNESAATSRKLLALDPAYLTAQAQYAVTLLLLGQLPAALAAAEKEPDSVSKHETLACIYWALDRRTESDAALHDLEQGFADRNAYEIAAAHAYRGEANAAFGGFRRLPATQGIPLNCEG